MGILGGEVRIGDDNVDNSPMQSGQLLVTLAMSRDIRIDNVVNNPVPRTFHAKNTKEFLEKFGGVLSGLKVLDLVCG